MKQEFDHTIENINNFIRENLSVGETKKMSDCAVIDQGLIALHVWISSTNEQSIYSIVNLFSEKVEYGNYNFKDFTILRKK